MVNPAATQAARWLRKRVRGAFGYLSGVPIQPSSISADWPEYRLSLRAPVVEYGLGEVPQARTYGDPIRQRGRGSGLRCKNSQGRHNGNFSKARS